MRSEPPLRPALLRELMGSRYARSGPRKARPCARFRRPLGSASVSLRGRAGPERGLQRACSPRCVRPRPAALGGVDLVSESWPWSRRPPTAPSRPSPGCGRSLRPPPDPSSHRERPEPQTLRGHPEAACCSASLTGAAPTRLAVGSLHVSARSRRTARARASAAGLSRTLFLGEGQQRLAAALHVDTTAPSTRTTRAPALRPGRSPSRSGQGSDAPYGLAGSQAARTRACGCPAPLLRPQPVDRPGQGELAAPRPLTKYRAGTAGLLERGQCPVGRPEPPLGVRSARCPGSARRTGRHGGDVAGQPGRRRHLAAADHQ